MDYLVTRGRFAVATAVTGILTILAGGTLYWIDSRGFQLSWIASGPGIGCTRWAGSGAGHVSVS